METHLERLVMAIEQIGHETRQTTTGREVRVYLSGVDPDPSCVVEWNGHKAGQRVFSFTFGGERHLALAYVYARVG